MTDPVQLDASDLLNAKDFALFQAKDPNWFLGAAGETIREYCEWHIFPVESTQNEECKIGAAGIIMLPTLELKSVESLTFRGIIISPQEYTVHKAGYITWHQHRLYVMPGMSGMRYPPKGHSVFVNFTHGFDKLPRAVSEVGNELTGRTLEKPSGVISDMTRGYIRYKFNEFGMVLSENQKSRLAPYCVRDV